MLRISTRCFSSRKNLSMPIQDYSKFISRVSSKRQPSAIRALQPLLQIPGMISLGGGMPHPDTFPFESMTVTLKASGDGAPGKTLSISPQEMATALQYSATNGLPELVGFLKQLQRSEHEPPAYSPESDFEVCVFNGSQDGIAKAFDMFINPGDSVLVESPMYSGSLAILKPMDCQLIDVPTDQYGIVPEKLNEIMETWDESRPRPKIMYTVPIACNPTGASSTEQRKKDIYAIAQQHDLIILEDDPYYYLQFNENNARIPSYFSMDVDRRILRFDSFSKILSSGMRLGFATGPPQLIERLVLHSQATNLHPNGISQSLVIALFREWKQAGFQVHTRKVSEFYKKRRDLMLEYAEKHLAQDKLAEWYAPTAGMFLWLKLLGTDDSRSLIKEQAVKRKVILLPGVEFYPNGGTSAYVRASYSLASEEQLDAAFQRLADLLRETRASS